MKTRIAIIGTNGLPAKYGGWEQLTNNITKNLRDKFNFIVYTSSYAAEKGLTEFNGAILKVIMLRANGVQSIFYDSISLFDAVIKYDVLLVMGTSGCIVFPFIKLFKKKIILCPDGIEWKREKWNRIVKSFLHISERIGIKYADIIVSDNKRISEYITKEYNRESVLIEYGGDHTSSIRMTEETKKKYLIEPNKYAFKVCRIEPENNIHLILEAFKDYRVLLVIVGNWNYSKYGRTLKEKYCNISNFRLLDPIYEQSSLDELRSNCSIYIHGHSVGGTNPSLVEAMCLGLFIITFRVGYNIETTENSALYFNSVLELKEILNLFMNNKIEVSSYKQKMKEISNRRYKWEYIANKYENIFQSIKVLVLI